MNTEGEVPTALVADDDSVNRRLVAMVLQRQGFRVLAAEDGAGALRLLREEDPSVIFLDASMPPPNGFEVCRRIRAEHDGGPAPYIIMLTSAGQEADRLRALSVGFDEFITKPFSPSKLNIKLQQLRSEMLAPSDVRHDGPDWDPAVLQELRLGLGDDGAMVRQLVELYLTKTPALVDALVAAVAAGDDAGVRATAHSLKGSTLTIGGRKVGALCGELMTESSDRFDLLSMVDRVQLGFAALSAELNAYLRQPTARGRTTEGTAG